MAKKPDYNFNNLTKVQKDCLTLIESLGIYELRALARVFGDNSPTVQKRNDHIKVVMEKIISGEDISPIPLRQGRPYKELSNISGILAELSQITGKDYTLKTNQERGFSRPKKVVGFKQLEEDVFKKKLFPIEVSGVVCEKSDGDFYLINQFNGSTVLIKKDFDSDICEYDHIEGTAVVMNSDKEYILDSIKTINFQPKQKYRDVNNPYVESVPNETLDGITLGTRYILKDCRFADVGSKLKSTIKKFKEKGILTLAIVPNVMFEDFNALNSLGFNASFLLKYDERPFIIHETLTMFIKLVERLQEQGKSVAIFVQDITTLANDVDFAFKNNTKALMGHTEAAVELVKELVMLARAGGKGKSTTLFTTMDESDMFDQLYVSSVFKVSKKISI